MRKFKDEYEYLVHLVRCAVQETNPVEIPDGLSFDKVFKLGKEHEVANIAFVSVEKLQNKPQNDLYLMWKTIYGLAIQRHVNQMCAKQQIVDALNNAAIRHVETQGTIMKTLYPHPEWRMMSDIDFIIDSENLGSAESVLQKLGYKTENPRGIEVDAYNDNNVAVELHSMFFNPESACYKTLGNAFDFSTQIGDTYSYALTNTMFYLYNLLHCVKHFVQRGAGIRRITDMYIMRKQLSDKVDFDYINTVVQNSGYKSAVDEIFAVVDKWFLDAKTIDDISDIEERIYFSNNHGSQQTLIKNEYIASKNKGENFYKTRKVFSLIFPKKQIIYDTYPLTKKKRLPLIICWFYRWFVILTSFNKIKSSIKHLLLIKNTKIK